MLSEHDLNGNSLAELLLKYMEDWGALKTMGDRVLKVAKPDAARSIVDNLERMIEGVS
jgi:UDP-N-acetylglucosamine:LPS N-acetylglucosamine transferase